MIKWLKRLPLNMLLDLLNALDLIPGLDIFATTNDRSDWGYDFESGGRGWYLTIYLYKLEWIISREGPARGVIAD